MKRIHFVDLPDTWSDLLSYSEEWLSAVAKGEDLSIRQLSYRFISDDEMLEENRRLLRHDYYTDIITYGEVVRSRISGDIIISYDRVRDNSNTLNKSVIDERDRVLVHGLLHLCGYGDKTEEEELKMRQLEDKYLLLRP
ncbi:MAG: rRNA maturation RNase YbeY [Flavobacteriia bacterium]|nr:rRNA maturation RNase YbeY [Flavobacteriia bacterium]